MSGKSRPYTLGRRAESQAETRLRIVEAAVELHGTVGPAQTSLSMVAEKAGVQRNTLYAHFPDERALLMACSGLSMERDPPPGAAAWRDLDKGKRLRTGLRAIYDWYADGAQLLSCVMRDAETHPVVREVSELRYAPVIGEWIDVLGAGLTQKQRVMLGLALNFFSWRSLSREGGLSQAAAVSAMAHAIETAG